MIVHPKDFFAHKISATELFFLRWRLLRFVHCVHWTFPLFLIKYTMSVFAYVSFGPYLLFLDFLDFRSNFSWDRTSCVLFLTSCDFRLFFFSSFDFYLLIFISLNPSGSEKILKTTSLWF